MAAQHFTAKKEEKKEEEQEEQEAPTQPEEGQTQDRPNFEQACWREKERDRLELLAFSFLGLDFHGLAWRTQDRPNFKPASWRQRERERLELLAFLSWALAFTAWPGRQA